MSKKSPTWRVALCRMRLLHHWVTMSNPDGERYRGCNVCGRQRFTGFAAFPGG